MQWWNTVCTLSITHHKSLSPSWLIKARDELQPCPWEMFFRTDGRTEEGLGDSGGCPWEMSYRRDRGRSEDTDLRPVLFMELQTDWLSPYPRSHTLFIMWAFSHLFLPTDFAQQNMLNHLRVIDSVTELINAVNNEGWEDHLKITKKMIWLVCDGLIPQMYLDPNHK